MTILQASKTIATELQKIYSKREAQNICNLLLEEITNLSVTERLINKELELSIAQQAVIENSLALLLQHKPIQQITGHTWFMTNKFFVDENVLIPRQETEELVEHIAKQNSGRNIRILDIGTGSGCIAISLKKLLPKANIVAIDISKKALAIAQKNAHCLDATIEFIELDFLNENNWQQLPNFDIIVSNPPYIKDEEKKTMHQNVLLYEPHLALFVANENALIFFEKIAQFATKHLKKNGSIWVEINESLGEETSKPFANRGFQTILKKDMQQKNRIIHAFI